ncbi:hypothetical protein BDQ17DRAFT_1438731 [Cyathus striatus]|nr:hypothetical protein BDQ17DRAFT_1438731 [Cyathus striatus]
MLGLSTSRPILITGSATGIGRALALALSALLHKPQVIACGRRVERLVELQEKGLETRRLDLGNLDGEVEGILELYPKLNTPESVKMERIDSELYLSSNDAHMYLTTLPKTFRKESTVIMIASGLSLVPLPTVPNNRATKAALHSFTVSLRAMLCASGSRVRVVEVYPPLDWLGEEREEHWDAVVVAVRWYDNPVWPSTLGLDILREKGVAKHAKEWRGTKGYEGKKILIIRNEDSSNDIAAHLAPVAHVPIYQSQQREPWFLFKSLPDAHIRKVFLVVRYEYTLSGHVSACLEDGSVRGGELYVELVPPIPTPAPTPARIPNLHRLILHAYNPTLSSISAAHSYTPFITANLISTWLSFAWLFPELSIYPPSIEQRLVFGQEPLKKMEERRKRAGRNPSSLVVFSILGEDEDEYVRALRREVVSVDRGLDGVLPSWSEGMVKDRVGMYELKEGALWWAKKREEGMWTV